MNTMTKDRLSMMLACIRACTENLRVREGMPAGDKLLMRVIVADAAQVAEQLNEVLQRVSREVVLDAAANIDYGNAVDYVMQAEVKEKEGADEDYREHVRLANEALAALCEVMGEIDVQLSRHHKEEEYARLYEAEKRRYMNSGTAKRTKRDFDEWKENMNCGNPSWEDMEEYRLEKVVHMFEKGVFNERVEHMQRAKRYPGELDFDQVDENHKITKTPYHHYAAFRKLVGFENGLLAVDPVRVGQHFFACRKDANAKANRTNFLKYMQKIELAQKAAAASPDEKGTPLNPPIKGEDNPSPRGSQEGTTDELCHFVHPSVDSSQEWQIHNEIKRLVKRQGIQEICQYLQQLSIEKKVLLPQIAEKAYSELVRLGMPNGDGYSLKTFMKYYKR